MSLHRYLLCSLASIAETLLSPVPTPLDSSGTVKKAIILLSSKSDYIVYLCTCIMT